MSCASAGAMPEDFAEQAAREARRLAAQARDWWLAMSPGRGGPSWGPPGHGWGPGGPGGSAGPFGPGGPFGPAGPFGPQGFFGGGRRGGRGGRANRGDVRLAILALLAEGPRHGYQLIQDIADRSQGAWKVSPGSIYPALSALQDEGLIDDEKVDGKRVFSLTEAGREYVAERETAIAAVFRANSGQPEPEELTDLKDLMWRVGAAAVTVMQTGDASQREAARLVLARTRRDLYRILAEDDDSAAGANLDAEDEDA